MKGRAVCSGEPVVHHCLHPQRVMGTASEPAVARLGERLRRDKSGRKKDKPNVLQVRAPICAPANLARHRLCQPCFIWQWSQRYRLSATRQWQHLIFSSAQTSNHSACMHIQCADSVAANEFWKWLRLLLIAPACPFFRYVRYRTDLSCAIRHYLWLFAALISSCRVEKRPSRVDP